MTKTVTAVERELLEDVFENPNLSITGRAARLGLSAYKMNALKISAIDKGLVRGDVEFDYLTRGYVCYFATRGIAGNRMNEGVLEVIKTASTIDSIETRKYLPLTWRVLTPTKAIPG